ncbi:TetR family transcriptional regulator [Saccharothrix coeruleofusca]|uniref:TetR family transcriptional regulator n=1 Tax=Saccharothrix coeruleofusca TaxID=33919 RepID=A0A918AGI7_9PSEU|nr:TetR family transcriptional regulator [Saccharothrix coeruleofusca]GGP34849.1 TetR family transcriptional regulator [Saccharothrix coeruleofusca]
MTDLTRSLLLHAAELLAERGSHGLRVVDVAARARVSRQTVYNEFGNKERLVQQVTLVKVGEFLDGVGERLAREPHPVEGLRAGLRFALDLAERDALARSVFSGANAEDMLPLLTTRGQPVLAQATEVFAEHVRRHWPALPAERVRLVAETTARLGMSHLLTPTTHDPVDDVVAVVAALLPATPAPATPAPAT